MGGGEGERTRGQPHTEGTRLAGRATGSDEAVPLSGDVEPMRRRPHLWHRWSCPDGVRVSELAYASSRRSTLIVHASVASTNRGDRSPIGGRDARPGQDRGCRPVGPGRGGAMSANEWECSDCAVRVRFDLAAGRDSPAPAAGRSQPDHWVADERGWHCLRCQREAVVNQPTVEGAGPRAQQRRRALVEFELLREPAATDAEIARRAKCTRAQVAPVRTDLVHSGQLRSGAPADQ